MKNRSLVAVISLALVFGAQYNWVAAETISGKGGRAAKLVTRAGMTKLVDLPDRAMNSPFSFSPNSAWLAFSSSHEGASNIYVMPAGGGEATRISSPQTRDATPQWSPDGARVAFFSANGKQISLMTASRTGGAVSKLMDWSYGSLGGWSPDGTTFVTHSNLEGSWDIWLVSVKNGAATRLTDHPGNEYHPRWSPDGSKIAFYATWSDWTDIYVVDVAGGLPRALTHDTFENFDPFWSPDGAWIGFVSNRSGKTDLWAVPTTGGKPVQITDSNAHMRFPAWSPDGTRIATNYWPTKEQLFSVPVSGGDPQPLTKGSANDARPDVSPNGKWVVFESTRVSSLSELFVMKLDGTGLRRFDHGLATSWEATWSPDGKTIGYVQTKGDEKDSDVWTVPAAGGTPQRLTSIGNSHLPIWCGGGKTIVFSASDMQYDGRQTLRKVSVSGGPVTRISDQVVFHSPSDCSPDQKHVLYAAGPSSRELDIYKIPSSGGEAIRLTRFPGADFGARFSPDGNHIAFVSHKDGQPDLYVMPAAGGEPRRITVTQARESAPSWSADGKTLIFSADPGKGEIWVFRVSPLPKLNQ